MCTATDLHLQNPDDQTTGTSLIDIKMPREPTLAATSRLLTETASDMPRDPQPRHTIYKLPERLDLLKAAVRRPVAALQERYKNDYDKRVRREPQIRVSDELYIACPDMPHLLPTEPKRLLKGGVANSCNVCSDHNGNQKLNCTQASFMEYEYETEA